VGVEPITVAVTPNSTRAYVTNSGSASVSVIDTATNTVVATIRVGNSPRGIDVAPEGSKVYVVVNGTHRVAVVDVATNTVTKSLPTGIGSPINVEVTPRRVYVSGSHLSVIDRAVEAVIETVNLSSDPQVPGFGHGLAVSEGAPPAGNPTIATQASASNIAGTLFTATATVSGGLNPTGEVIFTAFRDTNCVTEGAAPITRPLVNGTATAEAFLTVPGTYYWRALYTGDVNNNPATHPCNAPNASVVVRPFAPPPFTRTITGDFAGPVTVNAGESVHISNARVAGAVTVNPGGALVVANSDIGGGIVANRPGFLRICGSRLTGYPSNQALGVFDSDVPVVIGDVIVANGCPGNRFARNVNLIGNFGSLFETNIVGGNLTVNIGGPGTTTIRSNTIYGNLACSGNNPLDNTRPNVRNTVYGTRSGQCVGEF
jgi:YVTN family beta-propeller protein